MNGTPPAHQLRASLAPAAEVYPAGPTRVPEDLTRPTPSYKRRAWLAGFALLGFASLYSFLTGWFAWQAYRLGRAAWTSSTDKVFLGFVSAAVAAFFAVFLGKALFFVKRGSNEGRLELSREKEPVLFAFLNRLADEAGAPRPHRVFVSAGVNAAVFYDLSLLNLLLPSKKNLEIGLGLVHVLSLGELKAVLAHEFGHFAQRTMAVGRWVYISHQVAGHIVARRDALDRFLMQVSHVDIRIAWIGWVLRLIVWSIRAFIDSAFRIVVLAERALSREMELQADLVAVSVTGSDELIHALHKLPAADDAWEQAVGLVVAERMRGRATQDLFAVQRRILDRVREVLDDPTHGAVPPLPGDKRDEHRVFKPELAQPPRMWSTHPPNHEREENAKRRYVPSEIDLRAAWDLFADPPALRAQVTAELLGQIKAPDDSPKAELVPMEQTLATVEREFSSTFLDRRYRGTYLGRSAVRQARHAKDLYAKGPQGREAVLAALDALYPESLTEDVRKARELEQELAAVEALHAGLLTAPGGVIRHRGRAIRRAELPSVVEAVRKERDLARARLYAHDRDCRTAHRAAAAELGQGWDTYLASLVLLLHYSAHGASDARDAAAHLSNVLAVVTAGFRVSTGDMTRLVTAASDLRDVIQEIHAQRAEVKVPDTIAKELAIGSWAEVFPQRWELSAPSAATMGPWLEVIDSWVQACAGPLEALRGATLDELLRVESHVATSFRDQSDPGAAPSPASVPSDYRVLPLGQERPRQTTLDWWDRFQIAEGVGPGAARFVVASAIVGAVLLLGSAVASPKLIVYNGLNRDVVVQIGSATKKLGPFAHAEVPLPSGSDVSVAARTVEGREIESFVGQLESGFGVHVYNVAAASPLVEWTATYGNAAKRPERNLGAIRWSTTRAEIFFAEPPKQVSTKGGGATREVLSAAAKDGLPAVLNLLDDGAERTRVALAHAQWDSLEGPDTTQWFELASGQAGFAEVLQTRLAEQPDNVVLLRIEQDSAKGEAHVAVCKRHAQRAKDTQGQLSWRYLAVRCIEDDRERDEGFLGGHAAAPLDPWFAMAAGFTKAERAAWRESLPLLALARGRLPPMREQIAVTEARVRRADAAQSGGGASPRLADLEQLSREVKLRVALETGKDLPPGPSRAYSRLHAGDLAGALSSCSQAPDTSARVQRFVAASDTATAAHLARARALPQDAGIDHSTIWSAIALARRDRMDSSVMEARAQELEPEARPMLSFADPVYLETHLAEAESILDTLDPLRRGHACVMGVIALGANAPAHWRDQAKALLFASERPYFQ